MQSSSKSRAAGLAHLRNAGLSKGDSIPLPLTMAAIYHAPGDATGFNQYGRFSNPTWAAVASSWLASTAPARPQPAAASTRARSFFSTAGVTATTANEVAHMSPSSRKASSWKPTVP